LGVTTVEGWTKKSFRELGACIRGVSYRPEDLRPFPGKDAVTILRANNIRDGQLNYDSLQFVVESAVGIHQRMSEWDIAICMSNGNPRLVGKSGQFTDPGDRGSCAVGAFCALFRPHPRYHPGFVRYLFVSDQYQRQLDGILAGSAINNLRGSDVAALIACVPASRREQATIAEVLSAVDLAIEQTEALIAKQQRIKTGLIEDLLTRGIDEQGNLRSEENHRFKDSPLGRIPVEWQINGLFDLVSIAEGQKDPREEPYCDWPLVAPDCVESGTGRLLRLATAREQQAISGKYEFAPGNVLYSKIRPHLRKAVLVDFAGLCSADMYPMRPTSKSVSGFIFLTILSKRFSRYAESVSVRSGFPKINRSELGGFLAAAPLVPEQERISAISDELAIASDIEMRNLSKLRSLKTALMQDLLTGRVRVTPLLNDTEVMGE
jgi:type I restriction enzyme S subunit